MIRHAFALAFALADRRAPEGDLVEVIVAVGRATLVGQERIALAGGRNRGNGAEPGGSVPLHLGGKRMLHPHIGAVRMLAFGVQHGRVGPARHALFRESRGDRLLFRLHQVDLERPGAGGDDAFVLEVVDLDHRVVPVAADERALDAQEVERGLVLVFVEFVGVLDAELRLVRHQVLRGVGDVDRAVIGLHAALVRLAVRQRHFLEDDVPTLRRLALEGFRIVHQHVRAPQIGRAVVDAVHRVPGGVLQALVDGLPARDEVGVDRLDALARDEAKRGVARGGDEVEAALVHQRDHLVRRGGRLHGHLAARLLLEVADPVIGLVRLAALDIAGPGDDGDLSLAGAEFLQRLLCDGSGGKGERKGKRGAGMQKSLHDSLPV